MDTDSPSFYFAFLYRLNILYIFPDTPGGRPPSLLFHDKSSLGELGPTQGRYTEAFTFAHMQSAKLRDSDPFGGLSAEDIHSLMYTGLKSNWLP